MFRIYRRGHGERREVNLFFLKSPIFIAENFLTRPGEMSGTGVLRLALAMLALAQDDNVFLLLTE